MFRNCMNLNSLKGVGMKETPTSKVGVSFYARGQDSNYHDLWVYEPLKRSTTTAPPFAVLFTGAKLRLIFDNIQIIMAKRLKKYV